MVKVYLHGPMVEDIKDIFKMIKRMDLVLLYGVMVENIKVIS